MVTARYHFHLTPNDGPPIDLQSDDMYELEIQAFEALMSNRNGWAYFIIDGAKCPISTPQPVFTVKVPNGKIELRSMAEPVFGTDFWFSSKCPTH